MEDDMDHCLDIDMHQYMCGILCDMWQATPKATMAYDESIGALILQIGAQVQFVINYGSFWTCSNIFQAQVGVLKAHALLWTKITKWRLL